MPTPALKTKTLAGSLIKSADLPEDVAKSADTDGIDHWFYASVEVPDREGDIVRVKGIDTTSYAQTGGSIKFIVNHRRTPSDDGRLPVVGKAVTWKPTTHKTLGVPAMAVGVKFAPTALGQEFKSLYDGGFLTDVSIGFDGREATPIRGGGLDYTKSAIGELSACVLGVNQFSGLLKALDEEMPLIAGASAVQTEPILPILKSIEKAVSALSLRLDDIESAVEGTKADPEGEPAARTTTPPQTATFDSADIAALKSLAARL